MDLQALKSELTVDPLGRGYSGMNDQEAADDLNDPGTGRTRNRIEMTGAEIWGLTDHAEFAALSKSANNNEQLLWLAFCAVEAHDPFGPSADFVQNIFTVGSGPNTRAALIAARSPAVSRAVELWGDITVTSQQVIDARAL